MFELKPNKIDTDITEELYSLIINYINKNKMIDYYFLKEVIDIFISYKELQDFYNSFEINNKIPVFGEYKQMFKLISLNIERIYKDIKKHPYTFNEEEFLLYTYIRILQTVLHELEHVNQEKKKINNTTLEDKILIEATKPLDLIIDSSLDITKSKQKNNLKHVAPLFINILKQRHLYQKHYVLAPHERLANIHSNSICINLSKKFNIQKVYSFTIVKNCVDICEAYKNQKNPTRSYLEKTNPKSNFWNEIEEQIKDLDIQQKLMLGLELSDIEHTQLNLEIGKHSIISKTLIK